MKHLIGTIFLLLLPMTASADGCYAGIAGGSTNVDTGITAVVGATLDETGTGTSVLEMIHSFEKVSGVKLNYILGERRVGDVETIYADNSKAKKLLKWNAEFNIDDMVDSAWKWQQNMKIQL